MSLTYRHAGRAGWLVLLAVMSVVGIVQMRQKGIAGLRPLAPTADATTETIFASITGERDVPRRLSAELARLPADRAVLILRPPQDVLTSLPGYLVAYQAMPRPAIIREARVADSVAAVEELRKTFAAVIFIGQEPPSAFPRGVKFGRSFEAVSLVPAP